MERFTNVAGGAFLPYVAKQIENRKKFLSESNTKRENKHLVYLNNKNAWFRLTSCVDVTPQHPLFKKYNLSGDSLAKKYILQGGTVENSNNKIVNRFGVKENGLYNMLPNKPLGFKPTPGITSIDLSSAGKLGTLQYATIKFICYDVEQLELMDALYMKLGFSLVLEWGHTIFLDDNSNLQKPIPINVFDFKNKEDLVKEIQRKRIYHSGNYDAMLGTISNFGWEIQNDGSYMCDIKLVGAGDVLESLKINQAINKNTNFTSDKENIGSDNEDVEVSSQVADKDLSILNQALFSINQKVLSFSSNTNKPFIVGSNTPSYKNILNKILTSSPYEFIRFDNDGELLGDDVALRGNHYSLISGLNSNNGGNVVDIPKIDKTLFSAVRVPFVLNGDDSKSQGDDQVYITLGHLMALITSTGMIYDKNEGSNKPHIYLDFNDKLNYCSTFKGQMSLDPRVCIVPRNQNNNEDAFGLGIIQDELFNSISGAVVQKTYKGGQAFGGYGYNTAEVTSTKEVKTGGFVNSYLNVTSQEKEVRARMMYILVNINHVTDILRQQRGKDNKGVVSLSDFLNTLLGDISKSLCGFNEFRISVDDSNKCMRIIDDNKMSLNSELEDINQYTEIPLLGDKSIVYNYSFRSKIGPNMASMVTIAAQANPESLGEDAFAISNLSRGLLDRTAKEKTTSKIPSNTSLVPQIEEDNLITLKTHLNNIMGSRESFILDISSIDSSINTYRELLSNFRIKEDSTNKASIIVPLDFSVEMDGISGIIPNSAFVIPNNLLPSTYKTKDNKTKIAFIIHTINQIFSDNKWVTKITGQTINIRFDKDDEQIYISKIQEDPTNLVDVNNGVYFSITNFTAGGDEARKTAELYLGRKISNNEWNQLIAATFAEASSNQTERAYVAAVILNRARKISGGESITKVLYARNQFQSVTGTSSDGHVSSINYIKGPDKNNQTLIFGAIQNILMKVPMNIINFTSNNPRAYGKGTNINYLYKLRETGIIIGQTVFSK